MAKRKEKPPEEGSPAWMATFSDLMNLLLCFFVLLFASSTVDAEKIQKIVASFNRASFSILETGSVTLVDGAIVSGGVTQMPAIESVLEYIGVSTDVNGNHEELESTGSVGDENTKKDGQQELSQQELSQQELSQQELKEQMEEQGLKQSEMMYDEISEMIETYSIDDKVTLDYNSQYVSMDLNGALLFDAGSAEIKSDAKIFMQKIAAIMENYRECIIEIEGHTDNIPIRTSQFSSNRYLSTARATKVYEYVTEQVKLIDENLKIAGYGESRPVASNATAEGRAKNRRVTIKIFNPLYSDAQRNE